MVPHPAQRAGRAKSSIRFKLIRNAAFTLTIRLSLFDGRRTSTSVPSVLFDDRLRAQRRDRAFRRGPELFLHERVFGDILERLSIVQRRFTSALLIGCMDPQWRERLLEHADSVAVADPGPLFAQAAAGKCASEDRLDLQPGAYDLCIAIGTLDTVNHLRRALLLIRLALQQDSLFLGALSGGETLPRLRAAMRAADERTGAAAPHVHPRIEPASLATLLSAAGFTMPVVDVDRVRVAYRSLWDLIRDLRAMGATNVLADRVKTPLTRAATAAAAETFRSAAEDDLTIERFELLHFAAWTASSPSDQNG